MEQVLGTCADRGIKVVTNAGGLNPAGCADEGARRSPTSSASTRQRRPHRGRRPARPHRRPPPAPRQPRHRRAADGRPGQRQRLPRRAGASPGPSAEGADVVVCPRVTDAAVVVGPAAWWWGWAPTDWDRLAGAVTAGHVIECGAQTTGGNFAFFDELGDAVDSRSASRSPRSTRDGSCGDHQAPRHRRPGHRRHRHGPAAVRDPDARRTPTPTSSPASTRSTSTEVGPDRVRISGVRGEPAPADGQGRHQLRGRLPQQDDVRAHRAGAGAQGARGPATRWSTAMGGADRLRDAGDHDGDPLRAGPERRRRPGAVQRAAPRLRQGARRAAGRAGVLVGRRRAGPGQLPRLLHDHAARAGARRSACTGRRSSRPTRSTRSSCSTTARRIRIDPAPTGPPSDRADRAADDRRGAGRRSPPGTPLGAHFGARSGDKGGNANVGIWARDDAGYAWLAANLTRRPASAGCSPRPPTSTIRRTSCPTCGRSTSCSSATSARASPARRVRPPGQGPRRVPPLERASDASCSRTRVCGLGRRCRTPSG